VGRACTDRHVVCWSVMHVAAASMISHDACRKQLQVWRCTAS
jgi:hypothetical protein